MRTSYGRRVVLTEQEANWLWELLKGSDAKTPHGRFFHILADSMLPDLGYSLPISELPKTEKEFNPGPWSVDRKTGVIHGGDGAKLGVVYTSRAEDGEGNALLVESAPDLVAIVPHLARYVSQVINDDSPNNVKDCLTIYKLIAQHLGIKGGNQGD